MQFKEQFCLFPGCGSYVVFDLVDFFKNEKIKQKINFIFEYMNKCENQGFFQDKLNFDQPQQPFQQHFKTNTQPQQFQQPFKTNTQPFKKTAQQRESIKKTTRHLPKKKQQQQPYTTLEQQLPIQEFNVNNFFI